jgi:serine/arginine repetitive matrix protein 1
VAKQVQINLTGFLERNTGTFMRELWGMLISAQSNIGGVPSSILEAKKAEILGKKVRRTVHRHCRRVMPVSQAAAT